MSSLVEGIIRVFENTDKKFQRNLQSFATNKEKVAFIRKTYPNMKAIRISEKLGISRERVRQLLVKLDLPTAFKPIHIFTCTKCGFVFKNPRNLKQIGLCKECFMASKRAVLICFQCRKPFLLRTADYVYRKQVRGYEHTFCSRQCLGLYQANHYGFVARPENIRIRRKK